jgi:hypothetical protein
MDLQPLQYRRITSPAHPALIESWCPLCGLFIAASPDPSKLKTAEDSHCCKEYLAYSS